MMWNCMDYELIRGKLIHRTTPHYDHQRISLRVSMAIEQYVSEHCNKCEVVTAPFSVVLDEENATVVQPDISVICNKKLIKEGMCFGPPDIIVEILSPSNQKYDLFEKLELYRYYDVGEYWIVDPMKKRVIMYDIEADGTPMIAGFDTYISSVRLKGFRLCVSEVMKRK